MKFKLGSVPTEWKETNCPEGADEINKATSEESSRKIKQFVSEILLSENLLILCGLGTSLAAKKENKNVAPKMSDLWNEVLAQHEKSFPKVLLKTKHDPKNENIETLLSRCQLALKLEHDADLDAFVKSAENIILEKCSFVDVDPDLSTHELFLRKVARRSSRLPRTQIFTTNYDLCFEKAAGKSRFIVVDGFSHTVPQEFDAGFFNVDYVSRNQLGDHSPPEFLQNVFHLYKLHGSVDWDMGPSGVTRVQGRPKSPCMVYPREGKYESSFSSPFLEMMARFQAGLRKPNLGVLVIGFGFNDNHISQPLLQALHSNVSMKMLVIDPLTDKPKSSHMKSVCELTEKGDWRLGLVADGFEGFATFLPDFIKETDGDYHRDRTRHLR